MSEFDQSNLDLSTETPSGPVECLGQTFESDEARREHYTELLREKLKDPEFRKIEGFPNGEDEDILALSDPPYYTACPNPWIEDFIKHHGRPYDPDEKYHREPFAADVSEGKNHPIYTAHSYHTKVPHRAIMRYILHYTEPGDVVFDGFCGTGMTGVASFLCGNEKEIRELGCHVDSDGFIHNKSNKIFSKLGKRFAILSDLSPAATFIARQYNNPVCASELSKKVKDIYESVESECGWMFKTKHKDGSLGDINYVVWSDLYICNTCSEEVNIWHSSVIDRRGVPVSGFVCESCNTELKKSKMERAFDTIYDYSLKSSVRKSKQVPVIINYSIDGSRYDKAPDEFDLQTIDKIEALEIPHKYPSNRMIEGGETRRNDNAGITHVHHFYTKRNLWVLSSLWNKCPNEIKFILTNFLSRNLTRCNRFIVNKHNPKGRINGPMSGTFYIPSEQVEQSGLNLFKDKLLKKGWLTHGNYLQTASSTSLEIIPDESVDYIFTDPPFGSNINYSELNSIWEAWLGVITNIKDEAIHNKNQSKNLDDYRNLINKCFSEYYRILRQGRWITVEFSNTKASIWNSIQTAISQAGFVVANVSALDKKHGGIRAMAYATAVKQDLVISAYKPSKQLERIFSHDRDSVEGVWQFIDSHLKQLPVSKPKGGSLEFVAERDPRILYDRMVAFYVRNSTPVPLSSGEFQAFLEDKYPSRDEMVFLPEQVAQYDKLAAKMESVGQMVVFVEDEKSAIGWLRQYLKDKPSTHQDIQTEFMKQLIASWKKFETRPELSVLLDQNFLKYSGEGDVPSQIHGYLSTDYHGLRKLEKDDPKLKAKAKDRWYVPDPKKMADVEAQREKKLLAEFWEYAAQAGVDRGQTQTSQANLPLGESAKKKPKVKKLKEVRTDAVRAGFMECQRNNQGTVILAVAEILPANVIEEDEQLQMIYDMAEMRAG